MRPIRPQLKHDRDDTAMVETLNSINVNLRFYFGIDHIDFKSSFVRKDA